jgi:phage-related protein
MAELAPLYRGKRATIYAIAPSSTEASFVAAFIESRPTSGKKKLRRAIEYLGDYGPHPNPEKCRPIVNETNLYELKEKADRLMYFRLVPGGDFVLTHGFEKQSGPPLKVEVERAKRHRASVMP